jgi:hypothetical protein
MDPHLLTELEKLATATPANEAEVETKILLHLFRLLGFSDRDRADKPAVAMAFGRERKTKHPDFLLYDGPERSLANALVTVEAKAPDVGLDDGEDQARSYALWAGTPFYVVSNGVDLVAELFLPGTRSTKRLGIQVSKLAEHWHELRAFLSRTETILAKERLEYVGLYLPEVEKLPAREFFQEYLRRLHERFATSSNKPPPALEPPTENQRVAPRIPVNLRLAPEDLEMDELGVSRYLLADDSRLLVVGAAGSGKSTLCKRVVNVLTAQDGSLPDDLLPVYVRLSLDVPESVLNAFSQACIDMGIRVLPNLYRQQVNAARVVLILDGLDEAYADDLTRAKLNRLLRDGAAATLLATRPIGIAPFESAIPLQEFSTATVRPLSEGELRTVLGDYLATSTDPEELLDAVPRDLREALRSPLFALMAIRVAQSMSDWAALTRFQLLGAYVRTLDAFFNSPSVRGGEDVAPGTAVKTLQRVAVLLSSRLERDKWSISTMQETAESLGWKPDFRALLNTGLLSAPGGRARLVHESFADFGCAAEMLDAVRERDSERFAAVHPNPGAYELLRAELSAEEELLLLEWLMDANNRVRRKVLWILRFGASEAARRAIRDFLPTTTANRVWNQGVKALAENGDMDFLGEVRDHLKREPRGRRYRLLANALRATGRAEYVPELLRIAEDLPKAVFIGAAVQLGLDARAAMIMDVIPRLSSSLATPGRAEVARSVDLARTSALKSDLVGRLLAEETDPSVTLVLLYVARECLQGIPLDVLMEAGSRLPKISPLRRYHSRMSKRLLRAISGPDDGEGALPLDVSVQLERLIATEGTGVEVTC